MVEHLKTDPTFSAVLESVNKLMGGQKMGTTVLESTKTTEELYNGLNKYYVPMVASVLRNYWHKDVPAPVGLEKDDLEAIAQEKLYKLTKFYNEISNKPEEYFTSSQFAGELKASLHNAFKDAVRKTTTQKADYRRAVSIDTAGGITGDEDRGHKYLDNLKGYSDSFVANLEDEEFVTELKKEIKSSLGIKIINDFLNPSEEVIKTMKKMDKGTYSKGLMAYVNYPEFKDFPIDTDDENKNNLNLKARQNQIERAFEEIKKAAFDLKSKGF